MKKTTCFLLAFLGFSAIVFGQEDNRTGTLKSPRGETYEYEVLRNKPWRGSNFQMVLNLLSAELAFPYSSLNMGVTLYNRFGDDFILEGKFDYDYLSINGNDEPKMGETRFVPENEQKNAYKGELMGKYIFSTATREQSMNVPFRAARDNRQIKVNVVLPGKVAHMHALRGGFITGYMPMRSDYNELHDPATEAVYFMDARSVSGKDTTLELTNHHNNFSYVTMAAGYSKITMQDMVIDMEEFGVRKVTYYSEFYVDLLFSPYLSFDNVRGVVDPDSTLDNGNYREYEILEDELNRLGARIGYLGRNQKLGVSMGIESGIRPGLGLKNGFYISAKIGMSLGSNLLKN